MPDRRLSALAIAKITAPGKHPDGGGLYLQVAPTGARTWLFRFTRNHPDGGPKRKSTWCGLGSLEVVPLAEARKKALDCRRWLAQGKHPVEELRRRRAGDADGKTFGETLDAYLESHAAGWRSRKHAMQWRASLDQHAAGLMKKPVASIDVADVLAVLKPAWQTVPETASRVRQRIEAVIGYAIAHHWRTQANPAVWRGGLAYLLPPVRKVAPVQHQPALPWRDLPDLMRRLVDSTGTAARCLAFLILTAARSGEARGARWDEIDLDGALWVVPGERMKASRPHRVPLSDAALAILREMLPLRRADDGLVFPGGRPGRPLSDVALAKALRTAGAKDATVHGLRSTFRDWCAESGKPREIAEAALAHANRDRVEAAYARSDLIDRRRVLMEQWGDHAMAGPAAKVRKLRV
ncbi:site-specific integrase [Acidiphilium sp.]|uniref:tyrosine-type recombinase/integrase n=1 Tax=Acidiphilium sp. TaxID=527 RepID=UPI002583D63D|nr:site-specific integrase [Acidiphilium sp.]